VTSKSPAPGKAQDSAYFRHFLRKLKRGMMLRRMNTVDYLRLFTRVDDLPQELRLQCIDHIYGAVNSLDDSQNSKLLLK
jgi:hypothetical protein